MSYDCCLCFIAGCLKARRPSSSGNQVSLRLGATTKIVTYNASAVKINNATRNLVHSEDQNIFFFFEKRTDILERWVVGMYIVANS
jgi:hypothetical protein